VESCLAGLNGGFYGGKITLMNRRNKRSRRYDTADLRNERYSPELIRKYEDPEYAKQAEKYERKARRLDACRRSPSGTHLNRSQKRGWKAEQEYLRSQSRKGQPKSGFEKWEEDLFSDGAHGRTRSSAAEERRRMFSERSEGNPDEDYSSPSASYAEGSYEDGFSRYGEDYAAPRRRVRAGRVIRNIFILLLILAIIMVAFIWSMTGNFERQDTSNANWGISTTAAESLSGYRNIAILGSDARKGEGYDGSRTDAIIVLSIHKIDGRIRLISVMRDSYLKLALPSGTLTLDKITHAHAYGGGVDTCAALNRSLDLNIQEYVIFDWKAVADTVDALGGVTVNVRHSELRDLNHYGHETAVNVGGHYTKILHSGRQRLDGVQAATYCRIRKTSGGDTGRARRYKTIVAAVIKEAMVSPIGLQKMSKNVLPEIRTNMSRMGMMTAILRAPGYDMEKSAAWPKSYYGGIIGGVWYAVPTTLSGNVAWLHAKAFGQTNYTPSAECQAISSEIIARTGVSTGNN
jgi:LCP family protein required for cell wall assembly